MMGPKDDSCAMLNARSQAETDFRKVMISTGENRQSISDRTRKTGVFPIFCFSLCSVRTGSILPLN